MPKIIPAGALAAIQEQYVQVIALLEISTPTPLRYCWGDRPIGYSGNTYEPRDFRFSRLIQGHIRRAGVDVTVDNQDKAITDATMYAGTLQRLTGVQMAIVILVRNDEGENWEDYTPMSGEISDHTFSHLSVALKIGGMTGFRHSGGPPVGSKNCPHIYKGARCKYAGAELTCDRTFATCDSRGNAANFGGWRWGPEPGQVINIGSPLEMQSHPTGGGGWYPPDHDASGIQQHPISVAGFAHAWQIMDFPPAGEPGTGSFGGGATS